MLYSLQILFLFQKHWCADCCRDELCWQPSGRRLHRQLCEHGQPAQGHCGRSCGTVKAITGQCVHHQLCENGQPAQGLCGRYCGTVKAQSGQCPHYQLCEYEDKDIVAGLVAQSRLSQVSIYTTSCVSMRTRTLWLVLWHSPGYHRSVSTLPAV
jgi:hypothetical protein